MLDIYTNQRIHSMSPGPPVEHSSLEGTTLLQTTQVNNTTSRNKNKCIDNGLFKGVIGLRTKRSWQRSYLDECQNESDDSKNRVLLLQKKKKEQTGRTTIQDESNNLMRELSFHIEMFFSKNIGKKRFFFQTEWVTPSMGRSKTLFF